MKSYIVNKVMILEKGGIFTKMNFINLLIGIIGIIIGAILLAIGNDNATFQTNFIFKLCGILIFIGAIFFVRKRWKIN
jgi:uncharacterized membrane protein YwaF